VRLWAIPAGALYFTMEIKITRIDGAIKINPAPPYITDYLRYSHRSMVTEKWQRVNKYETRQLHTPDGAGGVITFAGFFPKIIKLVHKNVDTALIEDKRNKMPEIDWERVKKIGLRDYQISPTVDFLNQGMNEGGVVRCTGGFGLVS